MTRHKMRGVMMRRRTPGETALYRFRDDAETLLYVGIADEPVKRWASHADREWWQSVATYEIEWFPSRDQAAAAEREAIKNERPLHNTVFNSIPYRGDRFPAMNLLTLAREHFGTEPFTLADLSDRLGIPYGTASTYSRSLVDAGAFVAVGARPSTRGNPGSCSPSPS